MNSTADYTVSFPGLGINNLGINRVIFQFSLFGRDIAIYWYGLLIALAFLLALLLAIRQAKKHDLKSDDIVDFFLILIPAAIIGARLYYVAFEWSQFSSDWRKIFDLRSGGLAFYGGVIGAIIGIWFMAMYKRIRLSKVLDYLAVYLPLGHAIGRWGNFFNQEAFGTNTDLPWGMISNGTASYLSKLNPDPANPILGLDPALPVHPTFFYEFAANILIFIILIFVRRRAKQPMSTLASYFVLYGLVRFFVEGIRTDSLYTGEDIRISQLLSAAMVVFGLLVLLNNVLRNNSRKKALARITLSDEQEAKILQVAMVEDVEEETVQSDDAEIEEQQDADSSDEDPEENA
ncbi:MAG: prolipoprotein diacylglyceryl transferase [Clostridiaceae bacterium]|nr:prolipoprotein diacylglyceryl transferase [Clostridiaceae bacterium]